MANGLECTVLTSVAFRVAPTGVMMIMSFRPDDKDDDDYEDENCDGR